MKCEQCFHYEMCDIKEVLESCEDCAFCKVADINRQRSDKVDKRCFSCSNLVDGEHTGLCYECHILLENNQYIADVKDRLYKAIADKEFAERKLERAEKEFARVRKNDEEIFERLAAENDRLNKILEREQQ